jgi:hypothetical protein
MAEGFVPPQTVRSNAVRGLELRKKHGRGGTEIGVARARDLSNGKALSLDTINRMVSYFARHEVDKKGEGWGVDSAGYIAWLLWGGDAGRSWANGISNREKKKDKSSMSNLTTAYFSIVKADRNADGTLMVYGKATDDSLDIDEQICDPIWLDRAMPEWFKTGGNIREQHSSIAAGVAKEYEKKKDGHYIHALVVDPISVKKVDAGVLRGFSIGIKSPRVVRDNKAANGRIVDGQIVEVSLVDRPANPNCQLVLAKSVDGETGMWKVEELIVKEEETNYEAINTGGAGSEPSNKELYNRIKQEAKQKFDVYPSAVANAWVVREYKSRGGTYRKETDKTVETAKGEKMEHKEEDKAVSEKPSKEDMLKQYGECKNNYMMAKEALDACKTMCKENGIEMEDEDMEKQYGESAEEESAEGRAGSGAAHELGEAEGKKSAHAKCLECGCNKPTVSHGGGPTALPDGTITSHMSTAQMISPDQTPKSAETETPAVEETPEEIKEEASTEETISDNENLSEEINAIVEKAVKIATESLKTEINAIVSAKEAATNKAISLESELATAKSLAVAGGPKRTIKPIDHASNDLLVKAATYKAKADASTDPDLVKGYRALHKEYLDKSKSLTESN